MPVKRLVWWLLSSVIILTFFGCGTGTPTTVRNAPAPVSAAAVSIAFRWAPPTTVSVNATASLSAIVSNDPNNLGVDWTLVCQSAGSCGALSAAHTASGSSVIYTPPTNLSTNTQTFLIEAFATTDHSKNLATSITVKAFASVLKGSYVFQGSGVFQNNSSTAALSNGPYQYAGVVVLDGNGGVRGGEQTYSNQLFSVTDTITGGSYFVGPDGRGSLTINTADQNIGQNGIETFSLVVLSSSQAFLTKVPNPSLQGNIIESSSATLELQTSTGPPSAGYAFVVSGTDIASASPTGVGGVLNIDSPGNISGTGSIADQDLPAFGVVTPNSPIYGTVTAPDTFGAVQFNLSTPNFSQFSMNFTAYIVDNSHIKLIETDVDGVNLTGAATAGIAIGQGAATGTFTKAGFQGTYEFGITGQDTSGYASSLTSAGTFTVDALGGLKPGFNEVYFGGLSVVVNDQFHAGCQYGTSAKTGRVQCQLTYKQAINGTGPMFFMYQTGNGNPPLILDADSNLAGGFGVGTGFAYPVAQPASFTGDYALRLTQSTFGSENDVSGQITVNAPAQTLTGTVDTNFQFVPTTPSSITGTFAATSTPNLLTGSLSNQFFFPNSDVAVDYYLIDSVHGLFVETDYLQSSSVAFGYFSMRTPVCAQCP